MQTHILNYLFNVGKDQSVMRVDDIEMDPSPPQKREPVTVSVKTKLCKILV